MYAGSVKAEQVVDFLRHLLRCLPGKLLIVWDGLPAHRSKLVKEFVTQQKGRIWLERLPAYAPELNPVEYIWGHWKKHELPNFCPKDYFQLSTQARKALSRMRKRKTADHSLLETSRIMVKSHYIIRFSIIPAAIAKPASPAAVPVRPFARAISFPPRKAVQSGRTNHAASLVSANASWKPRRTCAQQPTKVRSLAFFGQ